MSAPDVEWGDVEQAAAAWLRARLGSGVRVVNELPASLEKTLPLVQVQLVPGGGDDGINDEVVLDVDHFAATRTAMWALAEQTRTALLALRGRSSAGLVIDDVRTTSRPAHVDYGNAALRRAVATYALTSRAQAPA
ncbi:hypothetical protein [Streptomyces sp. SPB78]|uniref:hypothetical protein n=1 Tax=Streptomyces sp. (strain SPB78) TaxID=591157 RepID=UPI0001B56982|nr:hypothetical protein [Streptomyces sp. SPB78]